LTAQRESNSHLSLKIGLLIFMVAFSIACNIDYLWHVEQQQQQLSVMGFSPYPGGNDSDLDLFWKHVPDHLLRIVGIHTAGLGLSVLTLGATLFFALFAWGLRKTFMPYWVAIITVGFNVLCTGAFPARPHFPLSIAVDQDKGAMSGDMPDIRICDVSELVIDPRHGARGGMSYWVVGRLKSGANADLTVFDSQDVAQRVKASLVDAIDMAHCPR
jgi:hypothetical protein